MSTRIPASLWQLTDFMSHSVYDNAGICDAVETEANLRKALMDTPSHEVSSRQIVDLVEAGYAVHMQRCAAVQMFQSLVELLREKGWLDDALSMLHCCFPDLAPVTLPDRATTAVEFQQIIYRLGDALEVDKRLSERCTQIGKDDMAPIVAKLARAGKAIALSRLPAWCHNEASLEAILAFNPVLLNKELLFALTEEQLRRVLHRCASDSGFGGTFRDKFLYRLNEAFPFRHTRDDSLLRFEGAVSATEAERSIFAAKAGLVNYKTCTHFPAEDFRVVVLARWRWMLANRIIPDIIQDRPFTSTPAGSEVCHEFRKSMHVIGASDDELASLLEIGVRDWSLNPKTSGRNIKPVLSAMSPTARLRAVVHYGKANASFRKEWLDLENMEYGKADFVPMNAEAAAAVLPGLSASEQSTMVKWLLKRSDIKPEQLLGVVKSRACQRDLMDLIVE